METFPSPERLKTETLSREFSNLLVETKIRALLGSVNKIKEVESLEVKGSGNEIILNTTILVKTTPLTPAASVNISAILENAGGAIAVKNYNVDANPIVKGSVESEIAPYLDKISEKLREYVEKEEGRKIEKMEIINGKLKVTFTSSEKPKEESTSTEIAPEAVAGEPRIKAPEVLANTEIKKEMELKVPTEATTKVYKAGIIDIEALKEAQVRDIADARMTESKEDRSGNWFARTARRIWKHNLAQEWYRQREILRAREEITKSGNLYMGESKDVSIKDYEKAKTAILERFTSEYEDEMLKKEEKESKKIVTDEKTKQAIKDLIKQFAGDPTMPEAAFKEEQTRILSASNPEYFEKGKMYADNLLDIAREIRASVEHGEKLIEMDFDVEITLGQARESLNTEAKHNTFEKIIEQTQNSKLGKYLFNEPVAVSIAAGLYSAGNFLGMKAMRSKLVQWGTFGTTAILAGGVSAAKEAARLNRERAQDLREGAKGMEFKEEDMKRRQEMEKSRYETKNASDIIQNLEKDLAKISTGTIKEADLDAVLVNLSDLETRVKLGDQKKIDLVAYSRFNEVEKEKMTLDLYRAKLKVAIRKGITDGRIEFTKADTFDNYLQKLVDVQSGDLSGDIEAKDRIFKAMKTKKVAMAAVESSLLGGAAGFAFQEIHSLFQHDTGGVFGGAFKHLTHQQDHLAGKTTALEGLRRWMTGDHSFLSPSHGGGHEMILGNTHMQLPEGVSMNPNPDGTYNILRGNEIISNHVKLGFTPGGDLTHTSKELLAKDNILTNFSQTGGKVTEEVTQGAGEHINKHPELTEQVHRSWMDNDTPKPIFDKNELKLEWGGVSGSGIDTNGNYVFQVQHMTDSGSFHDGLSVAAQEQMKKGGLEVLLSVTKGTQHFVIPVHINELGQAVIDKSTETGKMLFENQNGHAVFEGAFAEVGHQTDIAADGGHNMQILATHIGTDHANDITETIVSDTTIPNVGLNVPADWDYEVPPFIPVPLARRPLEKGKYGEEDIPTVDYMYGGFSDIKREDYEGRMSETIKNNPDATLDEKKEIKDYLARQTKEHLEDLKKLIAKAGPMKKDCKLSICIPVAGHQEEKVIYKTLENYLNQTANKNNFEIVLFVNHPDKDKEGKTITPDGTMSEIKRFMVDHPELNVVVMEKVIPFEKARIGYVRKLLNDAVLQRNIERGDTTGEHIMLSNDADNKGVSPEYIKNFITKFEENPKIDSYMGQLDWDPESYIRNPLIHIGTRLFQYVDLQLRHKNIPSSGANFAFRSGIYAALNGYSSDATLAEDVDLGKAIKASRIGAKNRKAIAFAGARVSRLFTSSRRAEKAIRDGLTPIEQWNKGFSAFDDEVRKIDWAALSSGVDYKNKESVKKLIDELEVVINRTIQAMSWASDNFKLFEQALGWLGIKYERKENNQIKITDASMLLRGLEQYQKEGLEILKTKTAPAIEEKIGSAPEEKGSSKIRKKTKTPKENIKRRTGSKTKNKIKKLKEKIEKIKTARRQDGAKRKIAGIEKKIRGLEGKK